MTQSARILSWIVTAPIVVVVILFAVSNLDQVTLRLRPFPFEMTMPIWAFTLVELFVGFILGAIVTWIGDRRRRRDARTAVRRAGELEQALGLAKQQAADLEKKLGELRGQAPLAAG
jgi:putative membrane protein